MIFMNGHPLQIKRFPNGEFNLEGVMEDTCNLKLFWESDEDLFNLMLAKRWLDDNSGFKEISLDIAYMPYARMDRDHRGGSACSLRYVGEFIQKMGFSMISVMDPHSELTLAYLGTRASAWYPFQDFEHIPVPDAQNAVIMFPDAGAQKRYGKENLYAHMDQVVGFKKRDFTTGRILGYEITNAEMVQGRTVLIVDDMSSKGTTFLYAANELRKFHPKCIALVVSHCEETILTGELVRSGSPVDYIITTDSFLKPSVVEEWYKNQADHVGVLKEPLVNKFRIMNLLGESY